MGEGKLRATHREHLESLAKQGDPEAIQELADQPECPRHGAHLWSWFQDLHQTRTSAGMGPSRLTRLEIHAWEQDEGLTLERWERRTIMQIDAAWVQFALAETDKSREAKS